MHDIRSSFVAGEGLRKDSPVARKKSKPRDESLGASLTAIAIPRAESRISNHRTEDRDPHLVHSATLTVRREKHDVSVANVSSKGAMVRTDVELLIGERVEVKFPECNRLRASVRWVKEDRVGLEFDEHTEIIASARVEEAVRRPHLALIEESEPQGASEPYRPLASRAARLGLIWSGTLYWTFEAMSVKIRNISPNGAMLDCEHDIPIGAEVRLNFVDAGTHEAEVRWSGGGQVGIRFKQKFDLHQLANSRPAGFVSPPSQPIEEERAEDYAKTLAKLWNRAFYRKSARK